MRFANPSPPFEVADIIRAAGKSFIEKHRSWLTILRLKVLSAIRRCRTAALGGHRDRCTRCGHVVAISYNSCRNRHCPKCLNHARKKWLSARQRELLAVPYIHLVFTIPHTLSSLALHNKKLIYTLLFRASAATLLEIAANPKHLGAEIGFFSILHTWGQNLITVSVEEFLRRFLLHTLPRGFVRIRFFGYMANRRRAASLSICNELIGSNTESDPKSKTAQIEDKPHWLCPLCNGRMVVIQRLTADQIAWESFRRMDVVDTS